MIFDTGFNGHIFHVLEALDYGDAVSKQAITLDGMMRDIGFSSSLHCKYHHEFVKDSCCELDKVNPCDNDIIIYHFSGYAPHTLPYIQQFRCTKVCVYHNITPHSFFEEGTPLYDLCLKGREQLQEIVASFHFFWGDSQYNVQELIDLGADRNSCTVIPIVVNKLSNHESSQECSEKRSWIFLGRIASNKAQHDLVRLFANIRETNPTIAENLYLVGGYQKDDPYYRRLTELIADLKLEEHIILTGKISDHEVSDYLNKSSVFVSMSLHEGFGVPLIEAAHHSLPVVALNNTAIGETLGQGKGLASTPEELASEIIRVASDLDYRRDIIEHQKKNAERFSPHAVRDQLICSLGELLPGKNHFKSVSIVICTYNRGDLLDRCLDYLQYQTNSNFEVIVVNGPSTDNTAHVLEKYINQIKVGTNPERNLSVSRNIGIELSSRDLIAFIDDDALPFDDWIETLLRVFNTYPLTLSGLGGPVFYAGMLEFQAQDIGINKFAETKINIDSSEIGKNGWERSLLGTNTCFNANHLRKVGGFDEQFDYFLDESELCFRMQRKNLLVCYCAELFLRHEFAQSHNRNGKYSYNWFTICKNTAYYIAAYSGLSGLDLQNYVESTIESDRIQPLKSAFGAGEISHTQLNEYIAAIQNGVQQGLADAKQFPRLRPLRLLSQDFFPFIPRDKPSGSMCQPKSNRLHICIVTKEFPPFSSRGGIGTLYYHLASELILMGHHVTVITPGDQYDQYERGRFSVHYVERHSICSDRLEGNGFAGNMNWSLSAFHAVADLHKSKPVDIIETALWDSEGLAFALLDRTKRPPLVVRLVTPFAVAARLNDWNVPSRERELFNAAEKTLISSADAIIPISESIAQTIEKEHSLSRDSRWVQSYCGISYWPFFESTKEYTTLTEINGHPLHFDNDTKLIVFVGRLESRKGVDLLLSAANTFLLLDTSAQLLLAGRDIEEWESKSKTYLSDDITNRVHFLGEIDDSTREKLLHAAYCVIFPSRYESFGLVPLEAFVHNVPVVAARSGAIPEVVEDGMCGLLFEPENSSSLALCVCNLLNDSSLHKKLSEGAKQQIRKFSSRNSALRTITLYKELTRS